MKMKKENIEKENKKYLDYEDFKDFVKTMSCSQGFYGRLYENLLELEETDDDSLEELKNAIEEKHFTDTLDFVFWLEC